MLRFSRATLAATLYARLGVERGATDGEVKAAYRRRALQCHPDVVAADRKAAAEAEFRRVSEAYATLGDAAERRRYDLSLGPAPGGCPVRSAAAAAAEYGAPAARRPPAAGARAARKPFVMRDAERSFRGAFDGKSVHDVLFNIRLSKRFPKAHAAETAKEHSLKSEPPPAASADAAKDEREQQQQHRQAYDSAVDEALRSAAAAYSAANPHTDPRSVKIGVRRWNRPPPPSSAMPFRPFRNMVVPDGVSVPAAPVAPAAAVLAPTEAIDDVPRPGLARPLREAKLCDPAEWETELARLRRVNGLGPDNHGVMYSYQRPY